MTEENFNIYKKLEIIQQNLKVPKGQKNAFGGYKYRSCEDILEAVKPLLKDCVILITDDIVMIGDRFYVKATVTLKDSTGADISCSAYARESFDKKGMDDSQITGAASSYARKYALNGLFCIDDTQDADSNDNNTKTTTSPTPSKPKPVVEEIGKDIEVPNKCSACDEDVTNRVKEYSIDKFKKVLCFECQKKNEEK